MASNVSRHCPSEIQLAKSLKVKCSLNSKKLNFIVVLITCMPFSPDSPLSPLSPGGPGLPLSVASSPRRPFTPFDPWIEDKRN